MRAFLQTCCLHRFTYFIVAFHFEVLPSNARAMHGQRRPQIPILNALAKDNKVRGCHFSHKNNSFLGFLFRTRRSCRLTRRLYGFWRLLVHVAVHLTRPITHPGFVPPHTPPGMKVQFCFVKIPARVNHQIRTVRTGKFLSFSWFSFCVVYPVWRPGPQYNVRLVRQTFTSGGRVWAAPPLRSFKILKS